MTANDFRDDSVDWIQALGAGSEPNIQGARFKRRKEQERSKRRIADSGSRCRLPDSKTGSAGEQDTQDLRFEIADLRWKI
jgi:hypothetical protein